MTLFIMAMVVVIVLLFLLWWWRCVYVLLSFAYAEANLKPRAEKKPTQAEHNTIRDFLF